MIKRFSSYLNELDKTQPNETLKTHKEEEEDVNDDITTTPHQSQPKKFKYCNLCNQKLVSIEDYNKHLQSRKHIKRIKKATYEEIHLAGSIKRYLINKKLIMRFKGSPVSRARYELYCHLLKKMYKTLPSK